MKIYRVIAAMILGVTVSGCASVDTATRNAPLEAAVQAPVATSFDVQQVRVVVPETLKVSEANRYYPGGDIVWREDPMGDRHAQVKAIFETAMAQGLENVTPGRVPAVMDIQVTRFHALTEKARYTTGGVHSLQFYMILRNPETGVAYGEPQFVKADFKALGGQAAIRAEANGVTQKYRITQQLAKVIEQQLTTSEGYQAANLGFMGVLNQLGASTDS